MSMTLLQLLRNTLDLAPDQRAEFIDAQCTDEAMRAELFALLQNDVDSVDAADMPAAGALLQQALAQPLTDFAARKSQVVEQASFISSGQIVGPYRLVRALGVGGMGEVWLAERVEGFAQKVAIKWAHAGGRMQEQIARFQQERALLASLDHSGIARLIDGGVAQGALWFAMEYVEGEPLSALILANRLSMRARLDLMLQLCEAVHYAHQRLIVHRDLKPANIMVDANARARLLDFGIAKRLDNTSEITQNAAPMTLLYAAPEQIRGSAISTATDVYALGLILFELLCGQRPYAKAGSDRMALAQAITGTDPPTPSSRAPKNGPVRAAHIKGELDTITLKALARDPLRRYGSALAFAEDIRAFLNHQPIAARPESTRYRITKLIQRNRLSAGFAGLAAASIIVGSALAVQQARQSASSEIRALEQARQAESVVSHMATVLNRAQSAGSQVATRALFDWAGNPELSGNYDDPVITRALKLAVSDLTLQRVDFQRTLEVLDSLDPELQAASAREQLRAANNRTRALIGLGKLEAAKIALSAATRLRPASASEDSVRTLLFQAQLYQVNGDTALAGQSASAAAEETEKARDLSPLTKGQLLTNSAAALLQAGEIESAQALALSALAVWRAGKVAADSAIAGAKNVVATTAFLLGDIRGALREWDEIANLSLSESAIPKLARQASYAKALALIGEHQNSISMIKVARDQFCAEIGESTPDCSRITLAAADTSLLANDIDGAKQYLFIASARLQRAPVATLEIVAEQLTLRARALADPTKANAIAWISKIKSSDLTGLTRRNAVRALLVAAERMQVQTQIEIAKLFAGAAIELADGLPMASGGLDEALLVRWRAIE